MKINIQRFAPNLWEVYAYLKDYKYNSKGELTQITVKIESNYNIGSIYDIDSEDNENWAYSAWNVHTGVGEYPYIEVPYIERTFKNLNNLKGVKLTCYKGDSTENKYVYYNFTMTTDEDTTTTYLTKTSATAVLKGNVLNSLNTYDYNNAPSVAAVRNYFENGNAVQSQKEWLKNLILETTHPVGSLEINTSGINPSEYLGGEWESFGSGRTLVGVDSNDSDFDTAEETGGEKTHTLTAAEMPSHGHVTRWWNNAGTLGNAKGWTNYGATQTEMTYGMRPPNGTWMNDKFSAAQGGLGDQIGATDAAGGSKAHNNLQPYITVYFWKRIH